MTPSSSASTSVVRRSTPSTPVSGKNVSSTPTSVGRSGSDARWLKKYKGRFLVFEGPDGSGKSTQFRRLATLCDEVNVVHTEVREPGGTPVGEAIRNVLLDKELTMGVRCETLLYMASRAELVEQRIIPALKHNELVLADRFVPSTLAYQGAAGGMKTSDISAVARMATQGLMPDLVIVFDIDEQAAAKRMGLLLDRMESKGAEFHRRVRQGYLDQAKQDPGRYVVIDAAQDEEGVWQQLEQGLKERAERLPPRAAWIGSNAT